MEMNTTGLKDVNRASEPERHLDRAGKKKLGDSGHLRL